MKRGEKLRLEREISKEQRRLHNAESEVKLAEQAFDQFLQENDRNAVTATKRSVNQVVRSLTHLYSVSFLHRSIYKLSVCFVQTYNQG